MKKTKYSRRSALLLAVLGLAILWFDSSMKNDSSYKMEKENGVWSLIEVRVDTMLTGTVKGQAGVSDVNVAFQPSTGKMPDSLKSHEESFIHVAAVSGFADCN